MKTIFLSTEGDIDKHNQKTDYNIWHCMQNNYSAYVIFQCQVVNLKLFFILALGIYILFI